MAEVFVLVATSDPDQHYILRVMLLIDMAEFYSMKMFFCFLDLKELRMKFLEKRVAEEDQVAAPLPNPLLTTTLKRAFKM